MKTYALTAAALLAVGIATHADAASFRIEVDGVAGPNFEDLNFSGLIDVADPTNPPNIGAITLTAFSGFTVDDTTFALGDVVAAFTFDTNEVFFFFQDTSRSVFFDGDDDFILTLSGSGSVFTDALTSPQTLLPSANIPPLQFSTNKAFSVAGFEGSGTLEAVAPIPLPAGAWLLLSGLGALGAAGRRTRQSRSAA